ncbi:RWD domain-containing protein [Thermothelomyces heterothallicus CBS 202.75]|uniref:RWD domain-containing protein n=1 Tax=Thermothelomyces heterothallicus CBS 202.75 TaxID=1149848 RepID=UPI003743C662
MADDLDDPRDAELITLAAIYPEIQQMHPDDPYGIVLEVPVNPPKPVNVFFRASADDDALSQAPNGAPSDAAAGSDQQGAVDSHELAYLPPVRLEITLGPKYPAEQPPQVRVSTSPSWIPVETIKRLEDDASRLWEELGRGIVGFTYIDHVQQAAADVFGLVDERGSLELDSSHRTAILGHDISARKAAFDNETFECGVCLEPKKGSVCHRMLDCGHVFCVDCLQGFYNAAIREGDIAAVICLEPNCAKDRAKAASPGSKRKRVRTFIHPSELLQIPLDQDVVKRYLMLKYKIELESDRSTVYCPRKWCNGAARSKKHKKPQGLELPEASDNSASEGEEEDEKDSPEGEDNKPKTRERLAICEECSFAFCARCLQSWHGELNFCPGSREERLAAAELASLEYIRLHTTPCPKCGVPAQKIQGCNHMLCSRCGTHFCYLCSTRLDPANPYRHFNTPPTAARSEPCYMRLWELGEGDGADAPGFERVAGGWGPAMAHAREVNPERGRPREEAHAYRNGAAAAPARGGHANGGGEVVGIAREGPLVLRIAADPPAVPGRGGPDGGQPAAPAPAAAAGRGAQRGAALREPGAARNQPAARGGGRLRLREQQQQQQAARGAGADAGGAAAARRGRRRGGGAAAAAPGHRQHNNIRADRGARGQRRNHDLADAWDMGWDGELAPAHEEWVRQFVLLALNDEEHLLVGEDED